MALGEQTFAYFMPTVNLMGAGSAKKVGEQVKSLGGTHALIVTDVVLNKLGMADTIKGYIEAEGIKVTVRHQ